MVQATEQTEAAAVASIRQADQARRMARHEAAAGELERWQSRNRSYYAELHRLVRHHIPPGAAVLEVGCGLGEALAATDPDPQRSLGIDLSPRVIEMARRRHPDLRFEAADPEDFALDQTFDYVLISHGLADMTDIQSCLQCVRRVCSAPTRLILCYYSALWRPALAMASRLGLRRKTGEQNWLGPGDFDNLLRLTDFEIVCRFAETLLPLRVPVVSAVCNRFLARFWPLNHLCLTQMIVARPLCPPPQAERFTCSVVVPTRNEAGNIAPLIRRLPPMGSHTQVIFVDGSSTDGTVAQIERAIAADPQRDIRLIHQGDGRGKGDAVRRGFAAATGDVLMILDADLSVPPEDLPRFLAPIAQGLGEFINGTRLVYPMEDRAMRFLNKAGNRFFSMMLSWLIGQGLRDTLCGTKAMTRRNYQVIAANLAYFGEFDPFGDFDLIFGAARADLKILEVPVRYRARTYGQTNISRFRHGWMLLKCALVAFRRLKLR